MDLDVKKIFGYFLLGIGLACIVFALYSLYSVFNDAASPPEIFQLSNLSFSIDSPDSRGPVEVKLPLDPQVRKVVNLFLYYMFMLFIVTVGGKLGNLGIQFIREIKH